MLNCWGYTIETGRILTQTWIICQDWGCHIRTRRVGKAFLVISWGFLGRAGLTARCLKMAWGSREKRLLNLGDGEEERQGDGSCIQVGACVVWNSHQYWKKELLGPTCGTQGARLQGCQLWNVKNWSQTLYYRTRVQWILMGPFTKCPSLVVEHLDWIPM